MLETIDQILFAVDFKREHGDFFHDMSSHIKEKLREGKEKDAYQDILRENTPEKILILLDGIIACANYTP